MLILGLTALVSGLVVGQREVVGMGVLLTVIPPLSLGAAAALSSSLCSLGCSRPWPGSYEALPAPTGPTPLCPARSRNSLPPYHRTQNARTRPATANRSGPRHR